MNSTFYHLLQSQNWKLPTVILFLLTSVICCLALIITESGSKSDPEAAPLQVMVQVSTATSRPTPSPTSLPTSTPTPSPAAPTPTNTRVIPLQIDQTATAEAVKQATTQANNKATVAAHLQIESPGLAAGVFPSKNQPAGPLLSYSRDSRLILAHYFAWYDGDGWNDCNISAGDKPLETYESDDPAAIAHHIQMGLNSGLNGFTLHWFAPNDRTDRNFRTLLSRSEGYNFTSTVVFSHHIWHGSSSPDRQNIGQALAYIIDQYSHHPNFLRLEGKPVIFFTDVYRVPTTGGKTRPQFWAAVRQDIDPHHQTWWIAEGLDSSYLQVFDGLYVFKISHATSPHDYLKSSHWAAQVRAWENQPKLWIATISPGWDDSRASCKSDVRLPSPPHHLDRANGAIYQATFAAALASNPDWLIISSFNEWVEGSYIEPSMFYGDKYLQMTQEFVRQFHQR